MQPESFDSGFYVYRLLHKMKAQKLTTFLEHQGIKVENGSKVALAVVDDVVLKNPRILPEGATIEAGKFPDGSEVIVLQAEKVSYDAGHFNYTNITDDVIEQAQRRADNAKIVEMAAGKEGVEAQSIYNQAIRVKN